MLVWLSDFLEKCKEGSETKQILLNISGSIIPMGQLYCIVDGIWYNLISRNKENYVDNDRFIDIVERECLNNEDEWGDLYTAPMDDIGNCELRFSNECSQTMDTLYDEEYEIVKIIDNEQNIVIYLKDKE